MLPKFERTDSDYCKYCTKILKMYSRINRIGLYGIAFVEGAVEDTDLKLHRICGRKRILHLHLILNRARNGFYFIVENQAFEPRIKRNRIVLLRLLVPKHQRHLHKLPVHRLEIIDHHIIIMRVVGTKRINRVGIVKTQVAIAIGVAEREYAFATESAVGIEDIGEPVVGDMRLGRIFHLLTARTIIMSIVNVTIKAILFIASELSGKSTIFLQDEGIGQKVLSLRRNHDKKKDRK